MWPWSTIRQLRSALHDQLVASQRTREFMRAEIETLRTMLNQMVENYKTFEQVELERDAALSQAAQLAELVEQQAAEIDTMRATISTLRKTGIVVNVQEGKR